LGQEEEGGPLEKDSEKEKDREHKRTYKKRQGNPGIPGERKKKRKFDRRSAGEALDNLVSCGRKETRTRKAAERGRS